MKLKKVRIVVEGMDATSRRWAEAIKGKRARGAQTAIISVPSWEVLGRVLSASRLEILAAMPNLMPPSIAALARALKRDFKNVHADVRFLADVGLLELREEGRTLVPTPLYSEIDLPFAA